MTDSERSDKNWRVFIWKYAPVLFWLCVIFYLSSGSGSASETSRIIGPLVRFFYPAVDEVTLQTIHWLVRKAAHVTEYAILAALAARAVLGTRVGWLRNYWPLWPLLLVVVTASADEFNQSLSLQRTGSVWDVILDISGGSLALALIWLFRRQQATCEVDSTS